MPPVVTPAEAAARAADARASMPSVNAAWRADVVEFLQGRRRDALRALRACTDGGSTDYWRWQGHAELARQLLERLGEEVPK